MAMLESEHLWFSRADLLDDPREARLTELEQREIREFGGEGASEFIRNQEWPRHTTFVNCWHQSNSESMAMWDIYGLETGSIAIKSTIGDLKRALNSEGRSIYIGRVLYLDWSNVSCWPNNVLGMAVRKAQGYKHESEIRLFTWAHDLWDVGPSGMFHLKEIQNAIVTVLKEQCIFSQTFEEDIRKAAPTAIKEWQHELQLSRVPPGIMIKVDFASFVQEIVVGPREPQWIVDLLNKLMNRYGLVAKVRPSELRSTSDETNP